MIENISTTKWTHDQIEVWDTVLTYTNLILEGKKNKFLEYIHKDFSGWNNIEPLPVDKQSIVYELNSISQNTQVGSYDIVPIMLNIHSGIAIVHYYLRSIECQDKSDNTPLVRRYTDILVKSDGRWILIADHFGIR